MSKLINHGKSFLLWYAHDLINFRIHELNAITNLFNIKFEWLEQPSLANPYLLINLNSVADIQRIMSRTVLIRSAYELWAHGLNKKSLHQSLQELPRHFVEPFCHPDASFRVDVEGFGKKIPTSRKVEKIDELVFLNFEGPVKLRDPDHIFLLMEYYGTDRNNVPDDPYRLFFGRWLADGQRHISHKINLKTRKFIGNTSMDPLLSLVMANLAQVQNGDLVLDPFVGSGSILIAAGHFGGYVFGTDIDYLMLHGKAKPTRCNEKKRQPDENILANFKQYSMDSHYLDVLVADASLPLWRIPSLFDAIITDPPYGIREPTERIGTEKDYKIPEDLVANHIPSKVTYTLHNIIKDLLNFSSHYLKVNGRLVFWMPSYKEDFDQSELPTHPCLSLVGYCEQSLTNHSSRYLITMEKIKENEDQEKASVPETALSFRDRYFQAHRKRFLEKCNSTDK